MVGSLVMTAKLNAVEALGLAHGRSRRTKANELQRLLPWNWKAEQLASNVHA
jgi:hypothetical protein